MRRFLLLALSLPLAACCPAPAATTTTTAMPVPTAVGDLGVQPDNLTRLTPYIEGIGAGWGDTSTFEGFVLVAQHDQPIYARGFGHADREHARAATADTSYRIGSVTKQFTAAAILKLEQEGKLSVTEKVSTYLPDYTGPAKDVTVHQLLTHTAGVPNYTADPALEARKAQRWTVAQLLATFQALPLEFPPGTKFAYSNSGYALLGAIVEKVSGQTYGAYVTTTLFAPAGMTRTVVGDADHDADRALGYQVKSDAVVAADVIDMTLPFAAGAVRSTPNDLVRWHRALAGEAILGAAAKTKLYTPALDDYAYGWVVAEQGGRQVIWHNGGIDGFASSYFRVPDADLVVVVLSNKPTVDTNEVAKAAVAAAFGEAIEPAPPLPAKATLDPALVPRLIGTYQLTDAGKQILLEMKAPAELIESVTSISVTDVPGTIEFKPNGQDTVRMTPTGGATFFDPGSNIRLTFDVAGAGPAPTLTVEQGSMKLVYSR